MYNGIINVYKEAGFTSHDVVAKLRGILKQKKIGHTGTLDPDATGVLPVCLGSATKLCGMLTDTGKEYWAKMLLGQETDTQDISGKVLRQNEVLTTEEEAADTVMSFLGGYEQIPPMYSAIKINGKKLYQLARQGKEIERSPRRVQINDLEIEELDLPYISMRVGCSKGTYIRTLCHDIGQKLGCGGVMVSLERTRAGKFCIGNALRLSEIERLHEQGKLREKMTPVDAMFADHEAVTVERKFVRLIDNGNAFYHSMIKENKKYIPQEEVRVYNEEGRFYGIYQYQPEDGRFLPVKIFMES